MKHILAIALVLAVSACATVQKIAPQTYAGWETNGVIGAVDGLSGAVLALCERADGTRFRVAVDGLAADVSATASLERVRDAREAACKIAGGAHAVASALNASD